MPDESSGDLDAGRRAQSDGGQRPEASSPDDATSENESAPLRARRYQAPELPSLDELEERVRAIGPCPGVKDSREVRPSGRSEATPRVNESNADERPDGSDSKREEKSNSESDSVWDRGNDSPFSAYVRYSAVGFQFAATLIVFVLGGFWLDRTLDTLPWLTLVGTLLGLGGGLTWLVRSVR